MTRKSDMYALIAELAAWRWTQKQIGQALGVTPQYVGQVLRDVRLQPFPSIEAALAAIPPLLRERIRDFQKQSEGKR